jgi:hypothetical protein
VARREAADNERQYLAALVVCGWGGQPPFGPARAEPAAHTRKVRGWRRQDPRKKALSSRFPLRANHEDSGVDVVGAGGSNPVRAGARCPSRSARGVSEGERPSTLRM